jgi:tetratricopeptide (TPR) repeat protein
MLITIQHMAFLIFFTWHYALRCGYISDDHATVETRTDIIPEAERTPKKEPYWIKVFNDGIVMYYLTRIFWRLGFKKIPFVWHLFSLLLHIANACLLVFILEPIFGRQLALVAVLFWAVNPMLSQNTVWISGRPYVIAMFFSMLAMLFWQNPIIVILCYMLAVITNISITFVPILLLIMHPATWQANLYILIMIVAAAPFIIWKFNKRFTKGLVIDRENFKFKLRKFNTFSRIIAYYVWTLFVPVRMGWYHQAGFRYNDKWEKFNIWTLAGFFLIGFLIFQRLPGLWFLLGILPNSNLYATNSFLQDRYLYFCSIGIALIIAPFLLQYPILFYCVMTFYITRSYMYSRHLINDEMMYRENWRNHPNSDYAINNLSFFLIQQRRYDEARVVIMQGISVNKSNKMLWYNLGVTWAAQGNFSSDEGKFRFLRAIDCWKMALQIEPRWAKPAEDLKKLIKILVDNKVLTPSKDEAIPGMSITLPAIVGEEEMLEGSDGRTG